MILYSNDCPRCKILKNLMDNKGVEYTVSKDFDKLFDLKIMSLPVLELDTGVILLYDEAIGYISEIRGGYIV